MTVHAFPKGISQEVNVIARSSNSFAELSQHVNHYATEASPALFFD